MEVRLKPSIPTPQNMARPVGLTQSVSFTEAQLRWLEEQFPEPVYMVGTDDKKFMVQAAQRGVIHEVRKRLAKVSKES